MRKYLIGALNKVDDNTAYPSRFVDEITKKDMLRCKEPLDFCIINVIDCTKFDADKNEWAPIKEADKYEPWEKGK